jgi:hypothetical protein
MNYMSRETYKCKIKEAIEDRVRLSQLHDESLEKFNEYDLQIDKFDDYGTYLDDISKSFVQNSDKIRGKIAARKRRIKKMKKEIRLAKRSKTLMNKSHCCFVLGVTQRQIGGRHYGKNIGHRLICAGRDATDIRSAGSLGIVS